jgi:hypothetical protein
VALPIVLTIEHGLEWCLCYEHIGQTCYNACLFGICSRSQAMTLYIDQTKTERINYHILAYLSSIQHIQNQNKRRRSSMCVCGQFISNDLDHTSQGSLIKTNVGVKSTSNNNVKTAYYYMASKLEE